jgi:hypothetical protein
MISSGLVMVFDVADRPTGRHIAAHNSSQLIGSGAMSDKFVAAQRIATRHGCGAHPRSSFSCRLNFAPLSALSRPN